MSGDDCAPSIAAPASARTRVLENSSRGAGLFEISLLAPEGWGPALPGQFVQLECPPREAFGFRRPFSLAGCRSRADGVELRILYGVVGSRTAALARVAPGEELDLAGPLGRPFRAVAGRRPVLLGGGRGIAPVLMLARQWCGGEPRPQTPGRAEDRGLLLQGARTAGLLVPIESPPCELLTATDDGSAGFTGTLLELLDALLAAGRLREGRDALFACGPNRMLAALDRWVEGRDLPCQLSLETRFGCGFGVCAGCAVPVRPRTGRARASRGEAGSVAAAAGAGAAGAADGPADDAFGRFVFACREGPVFDAGQVEWEGVHE